MHRQQSPVYLKHISKVKFSHVWLVYNMNYRSTVYRVDSSVQILRMWTRVLASVILTVTMEMVSPTLKAAIIKLWPLESRRTPKQADRHAAL